MAGKSRYLENAFLNYVFNGAAMPAIANIYVGLFTDVITDLGVGTEVPTTGGTGYSRVLKVRNVTNFPTTTTGIITADTIVTFPEALLAWGTIKSIGIFDAALAGNLLYSKLIADRPILAGETHFIAVGNFTVTEG